MGEIRFVGTGETRGYPYPVCKKLMFEILTKRSLTTVLVLDNRALGNKASPELGSALQGQNLHPEKQIFSKWGQLLKERICCSGSKFIF